MLAMKALADRTIADENQFRATRREVGKITPKGIEVDPSFEQGIQDHRKRLLRMVQATKDELVGTRIQFEKAWPAPDWHKEESPNPDDQTPAPELPVLPPSTPPA